MVYPSPRVSPRSANLLCPRIQYWWVDPQVGSTAASGRLPTQGITHHSDLQHWQQISSTGLPAKEMSSEMLRRYGLTWLRGFHTIREASLGRMAGCTIRSEFEPNTHIASYYTLNTLACKNNLCRADHWTSLPLSKALFRPQNHTNLQSRRARIDLPSHSCMSKNGSCILGFNSAPSFSYVFSCSRLLENWTAVRYHTFSNSSKQLWDWKWAWSLPVRSLPFLASKL